MRVRNTILVLLTTVIAQRLYADQPCSVCALPISSDSEKSGAADVCEDLYAASCLSADGKKKIPGATAELVNSLKGVTAGARNKAAQALGYRDFDDEIAKKLNAGGIKLLEPIDRKNFDKFLKSKYDVTDNSIFQDVSTCLKDQKKDELFDAMKADVTTLKNKLSEFDQATARIAALQLKIVAKDIPNFVSNEIIASCKIIQSDPEHYLKGNEQVNGECQKLDEIKRQATELYRKEGSVGYERSAEAFVKKYQLPNLKYGSDFKFADMPANSDTPGTVAAATRSAQDKLRLLQERWMTRDTDNCHQLQSKLTTAAKTAIERIEDEAVRSKPAVDFLIDATYTPTRKALATSLFDQSREDLKDLTRSFVRDPEKRASALESYDQLSLAWQEKPRLIDYDKLGSGRLILKENRVLSNPIDKSSKAFFDRDLSFFTETNSYYLPDVGWGIHSDKKHVTMMPAFLAQLDKNPYQFLMVVAHECGHNIGIQVSQLNGYDLSAEEQNVLACYKSQNSIRMLSSQAEETLADYFSAEVLAKEISKIPSAKRKSAVMAAMGALCLFADDTGEETTNSFQLREDHPEASLRVSGIFGADPSIRKVLGCTAKSSRYKTCGMDLSILNDHLQPPTSSPSSIEKLNHTRGVR